MGEVAQGSVAFLAVILTAMSAWFWMLGGRSLIELYKWRLDFLGRKSARVYGRLIAPLFFSLSLIGISLISNNFRWYLWLSIPLYIFISTSGHHSFLRRLIECWCYALPCLLIFPYNHLTTIQFILATCAAIIGHFVTNKKAAKIELLVNFLRVALIIYMVS